MRVTISSYDAAKRDAFRQLNEEWLKKFFILEELDVMLLSDPQAHIIDPGGAVFFAESNGTVVGTVALIAHDAQSYELGKMAVTESAQGLGAGSALMEHCITYSKAHGKTRIFLYSNTKLASAIHLYRKFGFTEIPMTGSSYVRTNIMMELLL
jgi:GNAT superfamily N-acetyltransferase